jgi:hypothetical protein
MKLFFNMEGMLRLHMHFLKFLFPSVCCCPSPLTVKSFTGVVSHSCLRIIKALQNRRQEGVQIQANVLHQTNGSGGQTNQTSLSMVSIGGSGEILKIFICGEQWAGMRRGCFKEINTLIHSFIHSYMFPYDNTLMK